MKKCINCESTIKNDYYECSGDLLVEDGIISINFCSKKCFEDYFELRKVEYTEEEDVSDREAIKADEYNDLIKMGLIDEKEN